MPSCSLRSEMFIIFNCNLKAQQPDVCSLRQQTFYFSDLWFSCSTLRLAGPVWAAPTATPAPPHCGDATGTESLCVTPVASTWSCMGSVPSTAFNTARLSSQTSCWCVQLVHDLTIVNVCRCRDLWPWRRRASRPASASPRCRRPRRLQVGLNKMNRKRCLLRESGDLCWDSCLYCDVLELAESYARSPEADMEKDLTFLQVNSVFSLLQRSFIS